MRKDTIIMGMILFFTLALFSLGFCEDITITTYYPSPYGSYNELTTTGNTYLATTTAGKVGIGTTAPIYKLGIEDNNLFGTIVDLKNTGLGQQSGIRFLDAANNPFATILANAVASPTRSFRINAFGSDRLVIDDQGNVGIGTPSPWTKLDVDGPAKIRGSLDMSGNSIYSVHNVGANYLAANIDIATPNIYHPAGSKLNLGTDEAGGSYGAKVWGDLEVTGSSSVGGNLSVSGTLSASNAAITNLNVLGSLTKPVGSFLIDHPLDPKNKVLRHSFVESPDMKNIYDGIIVLDEDGQASVELPNYFTALNKDYRYQLTPIGAYAGVYIKQEIQENKFLIAGGYKGLKVSWQVTGIRKDAFAQKNPIVVEEIKGANNDFKKGEYLYPQVF